MKVTIIVVCMLAGLQVASQSIGIGTSVPNTSSLLDLTSTNKGLLLPRMTTSLRNAIGAPARGLMVYDSTLNTMVYHNGTGWTELLTATNNVWLRNGNNIYTGAPNVGIGTTNPAFGLHVVNNNPDDGGWAQGIVIENTNPLASTGEAGISFRTNAFSAGKQWTIGVNQGPLLSFSFGTLFTGSNTRMAIDTIGRVGVGTTDPDESAQMHLNSTNRGLLLPRMTSAQRNAILNPALGLFVFDTGKRCLYMYDGGGWVAFAPQGPDFVPVTLRTVDTIPQLLDIGTEVVVDGELAVTKSSQYEINGLSDVGCVFVFKRNGGNWNYVQQIVPDIVKTSILFGASLALSGNILVVGSPYWDGSAINKGKVWYYEWDGSAFQFLDSLVISTGDANDYFGFSLALRGNTLAVGAPQEDGTFADVGGVYMYTFNTATKRFGNRFRIAAPNGKAGDKLGYSVDVDGAYVVAGAPFHPFGTGLNKGIAHVWLGNAGTWTYQDSCTFASANSAYERLGLTVSISGSNIVSGANYQLSSDINPGSATYFRRSGSQWSFIQEIRSNDADNLSTVPLVVTRGNWLLVGNSAEDHLLPTRGNVWVYALENNTWVRKRRIYNYTTSDPAQRWPDALAFDGSTIVIGSYTYNNRQGAIFFTTITQ